MNKDGNATNDVRPGEETTIIPAMGTGRSMPGVGMFTMIGKEKTMTEKGREAIDGEETTVMADETIAMDPVASDDAGETTVEDETTMLDPADDTDDADAGEYAGDFNPETHYRDPQGSFIKIPLDGQPDDAGETTIMDTPPMIPPVDDENDTTPSSNPHRKRNIIIAASVTAILLLAGVGGGYAYACNNVNTGMQSARSYAQTVDKQLADAIKDAQQLADQTTGDMVDDPTVLDQLAKAIDNAGKQAGIPDTGSNPMLVWTLLNAQTAYDTDTQQAQDAIADLDAATSDIQTSIDAKTLGDAKDALSKAVDSAQSTLDGTDGKVQDNATRDALSTALDTARNALDGDDIDAMNTAKADLEAKTNAVNDSVKAKEQADAEAAAAAAAAQQSASSSGTSSYSGGSHSGYTGGGYSGGNSSGGNYTGGGYTNNNYTGGGNSGSTGNYGGGSSSGGTYHGGDTDSMGGVWTPLEGDSWDYVESW